MFYCTVWPLRARPPLGTAQVMCFVMLLKACLAFIPLIGGICIAMVVAEIVNPALAIAYTTFWGVYRGDVVA